MSFPPSMRPYKMKLTLELEASDGSAIIRKWDALEFGPGIYFYDRERDEVRETSLSIGEYNDRELPTFSRIDRLLPPGNDFLEINLLAKVKEFEFQGKSCTQVVFDVELYHELVEIHACSKTLATYRCTCGAVGKATLPRRLYARQQGWTVEDQAKKNHKSHTARARVAAERKRKVQ